MTANELYELLDKANVDYEIVEIFEGCRWLRFEVDEVEEKENEE
jgi:glutaredoxin-related protein